MTLDQTLIHSLLSFYSLIPVFVVLSLLFFVGCLCNGLAFQSQFLLLPTVLSVSNVSASFFFSSSAASSSHCRWVNITVDQSTTTGESKRKGDEDTYSSHLSMDEMASFHLFLLSLPSRITHNICTPTELL